MPRRGAGFSVPLPASAGGSRESVHAEHLLLGKMTRSLFEPRMPPATARSPPAARLSVRHESDVVMCCGVRFSDAGRTSVCRLPSTGPPILRSVGCQPHLHRIAFYIGRDPLQLAPIPHPVIVGFPLPKRPAGPSQHPVGISSRRAFHPLERTTDRPLRTK